MKQPLTDTQILQCLSLVSRYHDRVNDALSYPGELKPEELAYWQAQEASLLALQEALEAQLDPELV